MPQFFERAEPNALWQVDLIEEKPTAIGPVHGVFYIDDHSRCCVGGGFFFEKDAENVLQVGVEAVSTHGLPVEILSDNGAQFRPTLPEARAAGAKTRYQRGWEALGTTVTFAAPYHPQTKGKEERFNRFVEEDFLTEVRQNVTSLEDLNTRWRAWQEWYNTQWTHSALGGQPPASRYRPGVSVDPATLWRVFATVETRKVRLNGTIQVENVSYAVPQGWERRTVRVHRLGHRLRVLGGKANQLLGEWTVSSTERQPSRRSLDCNQVAYLYTAT